MQCSKCGKENPENAWLCLYCLRRVQASIRVLSPDEEIKRRKRKNVLLVVFGALVFGVLLGLVIALNGTDGTSHFASKSKGTTRHVSDSEREQIYRDMIEAQSWNPATRGTKAYDEYTKGVLQGTSEALDMPMNQIGEILDEGRAKHWYQP